MRHARDLRCTVRLERARTRVVQDVAPQTHARDDAFVKPRRKDLSVHCHRLPPVALSSLYRLASTDGVGRADLERLLSRSGIAPESTAVVYGYRAPLACWLLQTYGQRDVRIL